MDRHDWTFVAVVLGDVCLAAVVLLVLFGGALG